MKNILHLKTSPATNTDFKQSHWFGMKYLISKLPSNAYTDSSFDKEITKDKIKKKRLCQLMSMHSIAEANLNNAIVQLAEVSVKKMQDKIVNQHNEAIEKEKNTMNEAAIKIQASIRGYLIRKKYEDTLICLSRKKFLKVLNSLKETEKYCFLNVGIIIHNAATKIQKSVKKALFRMKIHRISDAYEVHMEKLREPLYKRIAAMLMCYTCRDRVKEKIWFRMVLRKLKRIRERLAILKIKYIFKKKKLTMKNIRFKIRKYKRLLRFSHQNTIVRGGTLDDKKMNLDFLLTQKLSNMIHQLPIGHPTSNHISSQVNENKNIISSIPINSQNQDSYFQHYDNLASKTLSHGEGSQGEFSLINNKDHNDETVHSNAEAPSPSISKKKKKQMLLSVGMRKVKENTIIPILYQKELDHRLENHHIVGTAASIIRMTETKPSRFSPKIRSPEKIRVKSANCRNHTPLTYHYLNDTACSRLKFEPTRSPSPVSDETPPRKYRRGSPYKTRYSKRNCKDPEENHGKKIKIRQGKFPASLKKEIVIPTVQNGSFKIRADVKISRASRVQTPKSTKSASIRRTSAPLVRRNSEFSPVTLTFEAALPQYSELLTSLIRPIYSRFRPKTCHKISR
ncbi:hypothetical protein SteCoe_14119 [Stentor coeruleus]|uniref:Uncharacterized protein n=1 Tax=Stentor coeruleus TaxID=5963 RepID=A0A1R2C6W1_9CILI|nr:hypothetical protein SteCoe_14119 [Stentor coeruleus]